MKEALEISFLNNSLNDFIIAAGIIILGIILIRIFKNLILKKVKKFTDRSETIIDNYLIQILERFALPASYFVAIYIGLSFLSLSKRVQQVLDIATTVVITFFVLRLLSTAILALLRNYVGRLDRGEEKVKQLGGLMMIINFVIWLLGLVFLFDNMGYDVTAVVTGLGIGGIAVALAAQNILGDLFNYFVIFFDRPFEIGDFIIIDDKMGSVDYIGIKTTRIKSLSGEQLVFSNSDLTNSRIHNYKRMEKRRIVFAVGVVYETSSENLHKIPGILKEAVLHQDDTLFDRAHFASFQDYSLKFEVVYFVMSSDYNKYMDIQQAINLYIFNAFQDFGIEFAYPTSTIYHKNGLEENSHEIKGFSGRNSNF